MSPNEAHDTIVLALDQATQKGAYSLEQMPLLLQALGIVKDLIQTHGQLSTGMDEKPAE